MEILGFALAAMVGISLGLIGGGGSILTVPILVYIIGINPMLATSYSLFIVGSTSMVGAVNNFRKGLVNIKIALLFGVTSITTVFITRKIILPKIPSVLIHTGGYQITQAMAIMVLFAVLMLLASVAMIRDKKTTLKSSVLRKETNIVWLLFYGIIVGLTTGFLGAGGGFLIIPALVLLAGLPMKQAVGTSLLIIALKSLIGFTGDLGSGLEIDYRFMLFFSAFAMVGIIAGSYLTKFISNEKLKPAFGWFVMVMGVYILVKELLF